MPEQGDIIYYKNYEFEDGTKSNKLFIVMFDNPCLVLKTTSQPKRYLNVKPGCNPPQKVFFIPHSLQECFKSDTYIQLPHLIELTTAEIIEYSMQGIIKEIGKISGSQLTNIRSCLRNFKNDIADEHWDLLFKRKPVA